MRGQRRLDTGRVFIRFVFSLLPLFVLALGTMVVGWGKRNKQAGTRVDLIQSSVGVPLSASLTCILEGSQGGPGDLMSARGAGKYERSGSSEDHVLIRADAACVVSVLDHLFKGE